MQPGNISSRTKLGFLTAPTEIAHWRGNVKNHYPVHWHGRRWKDVEAAYQANKIKGDLQQNAVLITELLVVRFRSFPETWKWVESQGGSAWLQQCSHHVVNFVAWEGDGIKSLYIRCLVAAWEAAFPM